LAPAVAQTVSTRFTGNLAEWHAYLGVPLLAVTLYTARRFWHVGLVKVVSLLALMLALLSLGPTVHVAGVTTPIPVAVFAAVFLLVRKTAPARLLVLTFVSGWAALAILPVFSNAYPGRLMLYVFFFAGLLFAMFVDLMLASPIRPRAWAVAASVAVILTLAPALPFPSTPVPVPDFFTTTVRDRVPAGSVALVAPYAYAWDDRAMVWQAAAGMWFRMPEGYGTVPGPAVNPPPTALGSLMMGIGQGLPYDGLSDSARDRLHGDLARWSVRTVVIGPMEHEENMVSLFRDLLQREPEITGGVYVWARLTESSPAFNQVAVTLMAK
jgi:type IV secretory pathway VirB2 component (pilin)